MLGGQQAFNKSLAVALTVERGDEVPTVVWLGNSAEGNWTTASELCSLAIQVLDIPHAVHWGLECGKALLGAGQRRGKERARRMVRLRAVYRTTGPLGFHRAVREGLAPPACAHIHRPVIYDRHRDWRRSASK